VSNDAWRSAASRTRLTVSSSDCAFESRADAWAVDAEVPILRGSMREYSAALRSNGLERVVSRLYAGRSSIELSESPSELRSSGGPGLSELTPVDFWYRTLRR
jgi:hypothetical protein